MMCCLSLLVPTVGSNSCLISLVSKVYIEILYIDILLASWYSIYHNCTTSFNQAQTQVLHGFKSCLWSVGDSRWWESLIMVPAGNKVTHLPFVSYYIKNKPASSISISCFTSSCFCCYDYSSFRYILVF